ncbi:MAG: tyrosine-type recombinase/integrase [Acidiferrobacteraceae bacterium]
MNHTTTRPDAPNIPASSTFSAFITEELRRYDEHLRDVRGLAAATRKWRLRTIGLLLQEKFKHRRIVFARLRPDDVRQFLVRRLSEHLSASNVSHHAVALRSYLRYRTTCGDQVARLAAVISNPVHWRLATLPRALKPEEADRLLDAAASARRMPKRAYAIVRFALDLGLRAGEIAHLRLSDIDWHAGTVMLKGTKSLRQDTLPLSAETGEALADYLQHERPKTAHPAVFVRRLAGKDVPITSWAIQKVIKRACRRIGLSDASAHALRHTVACRLIERGSSLKEVADVLRHRSLNTTLIYAKLDTPKLVTVALPWPGGAA